MKHYTLVNPQGVVVAGVTPRRMTDEEMNRENLDSHKQGYKMVWVETWRCKDGRVTKGPNGEPINNG